MESGLGCESQDVQMTPERMDKVQGFEGKELVCMLADPTTPKDLSIPRWKWVLQGGMGWRTTYCLVGATTHAAVPPRAQSVLATAHSD